MKLLLRRDQKAGMMGIGKTTFILDVRAELTDEERANIKKYKLGDTILYEQKELADRNTAMGMLGALAAYKLLNLVIRVKDLEDGKRVECKDILEMLAAEEQIKECAETFKNVLHAAATFGGEEVLDLA